VRDRLTFRPLPRVVRPSYDEFYEQYDRPQRPVVITGAMSDWRAMSDWSHAWFKEHHGATPVELSRDRTHTTKAASMRLDEYVDRIVDGRDAGLYMNQFSLDRLPDLAKDIGVPYANPQRRNVALHLWLGPAGTFISLHKDNHLQIDHTNNIFAQIRGRKRAVLVSPDQDAFMYPRTKEQGAHWHSQVDWEHPDFERFPLFRRVVLDETVVEPGEILFIPGNYWHSLRSLDPSISVSCWWRVFRLADVVVSALTSAATGAPLAETATLADVDACGGVPLVSALLASSDVPSEVRRVVWTVLDADARQAISAWRQHGSRASSVSTSRVAGSAGEPHMS
jgi:hypothetical protein